MRIPCHSVRPAEGASSAPRSTRAWLAVLLAVILVLLLGFAAACGSTSQAPTRAGADLSTPEGILKAAAAAGKDMERLVAEFEAVVGIELEPGVTGEMPEWLSGGIRLTGSLAADQKAQAMDMRLSLGAGKSSGGQELSLGLKVLEAKMYVAFADAWYEMPAEMIGSLAPKGQGKEDAGTTSMDPEFVEQLLANLQIDPATWLTDLKLVGEEKVDGVSCYHVAGAPDLKKFAADLIKLIGSPAGKGLLGQGAGQTAPWAGGAGLQLPQGEELNAVLDQLAGMFQGVTFDVWVAKDSNFVRKLSMSATLVPPQEAESDGLKSVSLAATATLDPGAEVKVSAPSAVKPFTELQKDLLNNPALLGPFGQGLTPR